MDEIAVMKLAAISTAAGQNTQESAAQRIKPGSAYWSAAYADVCDVVDREMALLSKLHTIQSVLPKIDGVQYDDHDAVREIREAMSDD